MVPITVQRPDRWDHPLDPHLAASDVKRLLAIRPFSQMDPSRFSAGASLPDILRHDCRLLRLRRGDVVFREGQYGGSAYLVLSGQIAATVLQPPDHGASDQPRGWWGRVWRRWRRRRVGPEKERRRYRRDDPSATDASKRQADGGRAILDPESGIRFGTRFESEERPTQLFLQDIPGVINEEGVAKIGPGELFGELAAVTRSPRDFSAIALRDSWVLEIRWQGLRLLQQDPAFRELLNERYRAQNLAIHLREIRLFRFVPEEQLQQIVAATQLVSYGQLEWYARYRRDAERSPSERIAAEPLIAEEGDYSTGLWIVRSGFARLSWRQGVGHRTLAYVGKGGLFGLEELVHQYVHAPEEPPVPLQHSLRAIGYVDTLWIPKHVVVKHLLPFIRRDELPPPIESPRYRFNAPLLDAPLETGPAAIDPGLLEFLVDHRLNNGQQTMVVDLERCTRCDDCVRACAATHGGAPVFERTGPIYHQWMFPKACMHCEDPVCMIGCPTGAIHRDTRTGLVEINEATCIGCRTCAQSCPYDNIRMVPVHSAAGEPLQDSTTGLPILQASKCDFCQDRGGAPACYDACPHDALVRIDTSDMDSLKNWWHRKVA
ncbi:MAG: oxidoreductase [Pirellulaceae bacterium]|nr:MAG: oxidoreductase [Pirellulaceae bacterium]